MDSITKLNILAIWYSSNECGDNLWPDATMSPVSAPRSSGISISCHTEGWEISFDGGQTWAPIDVEVCTAVEAA
jgi:hypothetical protein